MSDRPQGGGATYEAPKVSQEKLDAGGNYVSPPLQKGAFPDGPGGAGTIALADSRGT